MIRLVVLLVLAFLLPLLNPAPALAHAALVRSDPAGGSSLATGPDAITLWFSEAIELRYSQIDVLRSDRSRVATDDLQLVTDGPDPALRLPLRDELERGSYTVVWSVLSAVDGHVTEGFFSFTVGDALLPSTTTEAELVREASAVRRVPAGVDAAVRWLNLLGQAFVAGALIFLLSVLMPALRNAGDDRIPARHIRRLWIVALAALVAGHLLSALVQAMHATRSGPGDALGQPLVDLLAGTRYGALWLMRALLLIALGLALWALARREWLVRPRRQGRLLWSTALGIAALVLLTTSLGSHAAARSGTISWQVANDWLHLLATSVWVGGLVALVFAVTGVGMSARAATRAILARFSVLAMGSVAVLIATGIIAARESVGGWDGMTSTSYGSWFIIKLAVVAAAIGLGAYHLLATRPALDHASGPQLATVERGFRRSLRLESILAVAVLAVSAMLTVSVPGRDLLDRGADLFATSRLTPEMTVTLRISPGKIGTNEYAVVIAPNDLDTFGELQRVYLRFTPLGQQDAAQAGGQRVQLRQSGPGDSYTFSGAGAYLALEGHWEVTAIVRRSGVPDVEVPFDLIATRSGLRPAGLPAAADVERDARPVSLLGALWLLAATTLVVGGWRIRRYRPAMSYGLLAMAALALMVGSVLLIAGGPGAT